MIQSFLIYSLLSIVLFVLGSVSANRERSCIASDKICSFWTWDILFALSIFALVSGLRWQVGVDHLSYLEGYENIKNGYIFRSGDNIEIGFEVISRLFAKLNLHFVLYFSFWAFIQLFFFYFALKDQRYLLPYIGFLIILGPQYLSWMNGIRQMLAATIFVYSINHIQNKRFFLYLLSISFATIFHKSAILLLPLYLLPNKDLFKYRYLNLLLILVTFLIGQNPSFIYTLNMFEKAFALIGYNEYASKLDYFLSDNKVMVLGPRRLVILTLNIIIVWYSNKLKVTFQYTNYLYYFNLTFIGILLHNLFANTGHLFLRPVSYFTIFLTLTTAYLLYYLEPKEKFKVSRSFLFVLLLSISYTFLSVIADYGKGDLDWSNFKFFWDYI